LAQETTFAARVIGRLFTSDVYVRMAVAIVEVIIEVAAEAAEIGTEVAAGSAVAAESVAFTSEVETAGIVAEEVGTVLEGSVQTTVEETVAEEVSATVSEEVSTEVETEVDGEVEEAIEEGESGGESISSTPTYKVILKWANRIFLAYTLVDVIGKKIYSALHPPHGVPTSQLTTEQQKELEDLQTAATEMKVVLQEMKATMETLKSEDLGSITTNNGKNTAYVSDVLNGLLEKVGEVSVKLGKLMAIRIQYIGAHFWGCHISSDTGRYYLHSSPLLTNNFPAGKFFAFLFQTYSKCNHAGRFPNEILHGKAVM